jgi:NADH-quinone oxidoreductase E subunit
MAANTWRCRQLESGKCSNCSRADAKDARSVIETFGRERGNLIPILHALQDSMGYLSAEAMDEVAAWLDIPVSDVYGTATFYTLFNKKPTGRHVIRLCDSPPCHIEGSKSIRNSIEGHLGITAGQATEDGLFALEIVSCLGLCGVAPAIMINEDVYGNLTPEAIPDILAKYEGGN